MQRRRLAVIKFEQNVSSSVVVITYFATSTMMSVIKQCHQLKMQDKKMITVINIQ